MDNWNIILLLEVLCMGLFFCLDILVNKVRGKNKNLKVTFLGLGFIGFLFVATDIALLFIG